MSSTKADLRDEVRHLADAAFRKKLISGHGDGEYNSKYQIIFQGKPRHYELEYARDFLKNLLVRNSLEHLFEKQC
jgi:hypothetical protein